MLAILAGELSVSATYFQLLAMSIPVIAMLSVGHLDQVLQTHGSQGNTIKGLPYLRRLRS